MTVHPNGKRAGTVNLDGTNEILDPRNGKTSLKSAKQRQCHVIGSGQLSKGTQIKMKFLVGGKNKFIGGTVAKNQFEDLTKKIPKPRSVKIDFEDGDTLKYCHTDLDNNCTVIFLEQKASIQRTNTLLHLLSKRPDPAVLNTALEFLFSDLQLVNAFLSTLHQKISIFMNADPDSEIREIEYSKVIGKFQHISKQDCFQGPEINQDFKIWVLSICNFGVLNSAVDVFDSSEWHQVSSTSQKRKKPDPTTSSAIGSADMVCNAKFCQKGNQGVLRSADMRHCSILVVHKSYWKAYQASLKLVEF